ncbi:MAG: NAD-binding protein [Gammaproteobacteria bacterium]|nr:NAD-binding protein [Gammaproteobacteria bacterium]
MKDHIIICGLGHVGFRTFEILHQAKQNITVIAENAPAEWSLLVEESGSIFINGDARSDMLLNEANIKSAKAILVLTNHDMVNVSIIMDARKLNPTIKIIARMLDTKLGKHIADAYQVHQVFSPTELAAPIFLTRIYDSNALAEFTIGGHGFILSEEPDTHNMNATNVIAELNGAKLVAKSSVKHKKLLSKITSFSQKINYLRSPIFANFRRFLLVLISVIFFASLFLMWSMKLSFPNALYFVTTTVTTVGYGDFNFSHSSTWLKMFGCLLMLSGGAALAVLFSSITEIILSQKLPTILGGRPLPRKNHIIVVGTGHMGDRLVNDLIAEKFSIVIIEDRAGEGHYSETIKRQVALIQGDPRSMQTLMRAHVKTARAIIVITDDDVENLSVSLSAKQLNSNIINIVEVFNSQLAERLQKALSLNRVMSISAITAPYFAAAVFGNNILLALRWKNHLVYLSKKQNNELDKSNNIADQLLQLEINSIPLSSTSIE